MLAVDPGELEIESEPGRVTHIQTTLQAALPGLEESYSQQIDVWVSDMFLQHDLSPVEMLRLSGKVLRAGAVCVVTLKGAPGYSQRAVNAAYAPYIQDFHSMCHNVSVSHLLSNKERERTLLGYWRGDA